MIFNGIDIIDINRIKKTIEKYVIDLKINAFIQKKLKDPN